jgi:hypothetical protein
MVPGMVKLQEPADTIVSRFTAAWVQDKAIERAMRRLVLVMLGIGVAGLAGFVLTIALERPVLLLVTAGAVASIIAVNARRRAYARLDIPDRKLQTVLRVLKILRADIPRAERVALAVDLREYDASAPSAARVATFTDAWFRLSVRLADGNVVTLLLTDRIKRKIKRKGRRRYGCHGRIRVLVHLAKDNRPAAAVAASLEARRGAAGHPVAQIAAGSESRVVVSLQTRRLTDPAQLPAGDELLRALGWVYGGIAAARRTA